MYGKGSVKAENLDQDRIEDKELFDKISNTLKQLCLKQEIINIAQFNIVVSKKYYITEEILLKELKCRISELISNNTKIYIEQLEIDISVAIIYKILGEQS
ncbi:hypothetical protein BHF71_08205 [Vulcanibacillus modesticaldus]|uniref:Uncharacterized protein n=1 Tax=Vulcanibacillus modesticaldus TaxID=337097 RepID=A0A1D2YVE7_9BACI|nr:hypothetical protein [Vulcanibacillus modesticaldus]OEF99595.1 hypothetical protein BHF71_08205 [Vulcanibacillus modesticaldus]